MISINKYRLISVWFEDYTPKNYRKDGIPQERIEEVGLTLDEVRNKIKHSKSLSKGSWKFERYEIDDGKYKQYELITVERNVEISNEESKSKKPLKVCTEKVLFCKCLHEIENKLPLTLDCFLSCSDQKEILRKRKLEKSNVIATNS